MRLSKASPPNTLTAAAQPSPSPNSAPERADRLHHSVVAIFFGSGVLALIPTVFFTNRIFTNSDIAMKQGRYAEVTLLDRALSSPSTFFTLAMMLAGVAVWNLGLVPRGIRISFVRALCGAILSLLVYPAGMMAIIFAVFGGDALLHKFGLDWPHAGASTWSRLLAYWPMTMILCVTGTLTVLLSALALAFVTRSWPRRVILWSIATSVGTLLCTLVFSLVQHKLLFPTIPLWSGLVNYLGDMLAFSAIWNVQAPIVIGEPLLAALLGHWFYLAAKEYAVPLA
jgi:hypothetical protein